MTMGGISSSLNLTLARLNSIQSSFNALENISLELNKNQEIQNIQNESSDFQKILDSKMSENIDKKEETPEIKIEKVSEIQDELEKIQIEPKKKQAIDLKSKIDLKAQVNDIDEIIQTFSDKYNIDSDFIKAIIKQESGFNSKATSKKGAMGLMQLMPATAKSLGVVDAYNPIENIEGGVKYLKGLMDRFNNKPELALAAYNAGASAVKKYGGIPPYKETQNYVKSIMATYNKVKEAKI